MVNHLHPVGECIIARTPPFMGWNHYGMGRSTNPTSPISPLRGSLRLPALNGHRGKLEAEETMTQLKVIVEKHADGYVAYPLGLKGVVVGEGNSYEEALADVKSAIRFHIETFGEDVFQTDTPVLEAFVAETAISAS